METNLMTRKSLAVYLDVHENTIINYEKKGMPVIKMGRGLRRYELEKVMKWLGKDN